jgi:hypothetical protein
MLALRILAGLSLPVLSSCGLLASAALSATSRSEDPPPQPTAEDRYEKETSSVTGTVPRCGEIVWTAFAVAIGGGQFAEYAPMADRAEWVKPRNCSKLPPRSSYPKELGDAVEEFAENHEIPGKNILQVADGKPFVQVNDDDLHTYRYQKMHAYSKVFPFKKNRCGDENLVCEADGSGAMAAYNRLEFFLERAAKNAGHKPDVCKDQLREAGNAVKVFKEDHEAEVKGETWNNDAVYKTKKNAKLDEKTLLASVDEYAKRVDSRASSDYCNQPAK